MISVSVVTEHMHTIHYIVGASYIVVRRFDVDRIRILSMKYKSKGDALSL